MFLGLGSHQEVLRSSLVHVWVRVWGVVVRRRMELLQREQDSLPAGLLQVQLETLDSLDVVVIEGRAPVEKRRNKREKAELKVASPGEARLVQAGDQLRRVKRRQAGKPDDSLLDFVVEGWRQPDDVAGEYRPCSSSSSILSTDSILVVVFCCWCCCCYCAGDCQRGPDDVRDGVGIRTLITAILGNATSLLKARRKLRQCLVTLSGSGTRLVDRVTVGRRRCGGADVLTMAVLPLLQAVTA